MQYIVLPDEWKIAFSKTDMLQDIKVNDMQAYLAMVPVGEIDEIPGGHISLYMKETHEGLTFCLNEGESHVASLMTVEWDDEMKDKIRQYVVKNTINDISLFKY